MNAVVLERIAGLVQDLPALPAVAQEALALLSDPSTEPEELQGVLSRDQALALQVLRLANSAYYRRSREVTTLTAAVVMLGFKTIQTLVLSSAMHRVVASAGAAATALWEHSFAAAVACRELARARVPGARDREEAFLAGLFHDVGKGVMAARFPGIYDTASGVCGEEDSLGFHHAQLGQVLLDRWEIPPVLVSAVGSHHGGNPEGLGGLVVLGDWLAWSVAPGVGAPAPEVPEALVASSGLSPADLDGLRTDVEHYLAEEKGTHDAS